ncbi:hypothetical protein OZN62_00740 [Aurantiacibacter sp. MUD11]|uniref:hypothetical protein n=1 Tax=Aurantiacibacter sp. MUD11 TaxID=3003265 RepID=UPI0022AB18CD|nr:hypothetical protein [Aurantiacibacter sp. MUD11]WAT18137.1 hypothetical protein OZN62_00740 [Aurantiacibacter sp. MUD11]
MMKAIAPLAALALAACTNPAEETLGTPDPLPPLAQRHDAPQLAMLEHILGAYFSSDIANRPTVCASIHDGREEEALMPQQEIALIERFPNLAPLARCSRRSNGWIDTETQQPALVFTLHNFTCASEDSCSAWGGYISNGENSMSALYRGEWNGSAWEFTRDNRIIAE